MIILNYFLLGGEKENHLFKMTPRLKGYFEIQINMIKLISNNKPIY